MKRNLVFNVPLIISIVLLLSTGERLLLSAPLNPYIHEKGTELAQVSQAIRLSANYLIRACDNNGKFAYRTNLNPKVTLKPRYNVLRHAGTMYALSADAQKYPDQNAADALKRAAWFLKKETLGPVPERDDLLAVWSHPRLTRANKPVQAKLGGTGLGLVALLSVEKIKPGTTPLEDLQKMGRFICFMQKEDGSFYSKYVPSERGRTDKWTSLYYPGEAALGLLMLYEKDPSPPWLGAATKAIDYLSRIRAGKRYVEADHWALLATAKLLAIYDRCKTPFPRKAILQHAVQICESILAQRTQYSPDAFEHGCLTNDGRTCPTATRLEGLLAALTFLPEENKLLRERITSAVREGVSFLLRSQVSSGKYAGAIPRAIRALPASHPGFEASFNERSTEIRIDYVQHALSAMIGFEMSVQPGANK